MKVAIVNQHPSDTLGGSEMQCDIIASHLSGIGHEVVYLAAYARKTRYETPYRTTPLPSMGFFTIWKILASERPDILYWRHNKKGVLPALYAALLMRIPFVFSISHIRDLKIWTLMGDSLFDRYLSGWNPASASLPRRVLSLVHPRRLTYLLDPIRSAVSQISLKLFSSGFISNNDFSGLAPMRGVRVIRNSMLTAKIPFTWPRPFVAWVANIKARKNPELFIRLAREIDSPGVDFLMVGAIQSEDYRYLQTSTPSEPGNFHYLGKKTPAEVNGILEQSLFLVHTCNPEGFPNNLIQAWLQGKPTISLFFDPNGFIESEKIGCYSRSFGQFVKDTRRLIEASGLREELGHNALDFSRENFIPETNVRKLELFLKEILSGKRVMRDLST